MSDVLPRQGQGEGFVGAALVCEAQGQGRLEEVLAGALANAPVARGVVSGFGWAEFETCRSLLEDLMIADQPFARFLAVSAFAIQRRDPQVGWSRLVDESDPSIAARALRALGEVGRLELLDHLHARLWDSNPNCCNWAAWSASLFGDTAGLQTLREIADTGTPFAERAADLAARRLPSSEVHAWRGVLARRANGLRLAIRVAGAQGDPASVPWLIEQMEPPALARVAGEAIASITGIDLAYADLDGKRPDGFESSPNDDPADENVAMDPDENLPWPDPERIARWWSENAGRFSPGTRYLCGRRILEGSMIEVLRSGKQRQRAAAALELSLLRPGRPLFNVAAPARVQLKLLEREFDNIHIHKKA